MEGSIIILPGSLLVAVGTFLSQCERKLIAYRVWVFILVAIGVGAMWGLSMAGGIGGKSGHSMWWGVLILPYLIGWSMGIWGPGSPRWLLWLGIGVGLWYLTLSALVLYASKRSGPHHEYTSFLPVIIIAVVGVLTIGGCISRLRKRIPRQKPNATPTQLELAIILITGCLAVPGCGLPSASSTVRFPPREPSLIAAASSGDIAKVESLLKDGADVNALGKFGGTALSFAVSGHHKDVAQLLLDHGANVNSTNTAGWSALFYASDEDMADLLIAHGANVNARDSTGVTPLWDVARPELQGVVKVLLAHGADVNTRSRNGDTPLHAWDISKEMAELLLAHGADINAKNNNGKTPLQAAIDEHNDETVKFLVAHGAH